MVDLQINGKWVGRASVRFIAQPNSDIALPCIDRALVARIGLDFEKLPAGRTGRAAQGAVRAAAWI